MKCPVCEKQIENAIQQCPNCGFADLRTEFINENELKMWQTYVVYPCKFAYQTSIVQTKELQRKMQTEINEIKKSYKDSQDTASELANKEPQFKKLPVNQKKAGWNTTGQVTYKTFNETMWYEHTKCEISNILLDIVGNRVTVNFLAKKVFDKKGKGSTSYVAFKWKIKDDYGIVVADGQWTNDHLNVGDVTKGAFSISGLDTSVKYVLEIVDYT